MSLIIFGICFCIFRALQPPNNSQYTESLFGQTIDVIGTIKGDPDIADESGSAKIVNVTLSGEEVGGAFYVFGKINKDLERGDRVFLHGKLSEGFGGFAGTVFRPEIKKISKPEPGSIVLRLRNRFADSVSSVLDKEESELGLAYLFGMRNGLSEEMIDVLSLVGLTHLVVASGTHLGIIVEFFKKQFGKISRFAGLLFSIVFVFGFGQIIGWTPSITRAAVVSLISILGWYFGRRIDAWRIILFAILFTLLVEPTDVVDLGWQLSFASFIGIMIIHPIVLEFFYGRRKHGEKQKSWKKRAPRKVTEILFASVSAMIMCAPILVYRFGTISLASIIANILILPTIPVAMGLTFISGLLGFMPNFFFFGWLVYVAKTITQFVLDYHIYVMSFFSKQSSLIMDFPKENPLVFLAYLPVAIVVIIYYVKRYRVRKTARLRVWNNPKKYLPFGHEPNSFASSDANDC